LDVFAGVLGQYVFHRLSCTLEKWRKPGQSLTKPPNIMIFQRRKIIMDNDLKSTFVPQGEQTSADSGFDERGKAPTFHVQTGIRAGGFYDWWQGVAEGWNARDRATGAG
jgi:hypothetical protein